MFTDKILEQILTEGHISAVPRSASIEYDKNGVSFFAEGNFSEYFITAEYQIDITIKDTKIKAYPNQNRIIKKFLEAEAREALEAESREPQYA